MIRLGRETLNDFEKAGSKEWLVTNGIGGYASTTVIGANTRKYHGMLVASLEPPLARMNLVSKLEESVLIQKQRYDLSCSQYPGVVHPEGFKYLESFEQDSAVKFIYKIDDATLEKSVFMVYGENSTVVIYRLVSSGDTPVVLLVRPLIAARDFHWVSYENEFFNKKIDTLEGCVKLKPYDASPEIFLCHNAESFEQQGYWYRNFEYKKEYKRGLESYEDLYSPGHFVYILRPGETCSLIMSTEQKNAKHAHELEADFIRRHDSLASVFKNESDDMFLNLAKTGDSFLVKRNMPESTILAGYHWFTDWGRDALISLPGLCLVPGRYDAARNVLVNFARYCREGLIPCMFTEHGDMVDYSSADTSLWYFYAVGKYIDYTQDRDFVKKYLFNTLSEIMDYYIRGTYYGIKLDSDGLINFDENTLPLTWMNARVKDEIVTHRFGKVVEVNALWYNALKVMQDLIGDLDKKLEREYENLSEAAATNFNELFWNKQNNFVYDWIRDKKANASLRPNQILAMSLPYPVLQKKKAMQALEIIKSELLTPYGLRTLSPKDKSYQPKYEGGQYERDKACHQGPARPWLLAQYITACVKTYGRTKNTIEEAKNLVNSFRPHLLEKGVGTISEMFNADEPFEPKGCISSAMNVAEILRVFAEDIQGRKPIEMPKNAKQKV